MRSLTLSRSATVTLDGSGNGSAELGPALPGETWYPAVVSVSMTGSAPAGVATVYVYAGNGASQGDFVDSTYNVLGAASGAIEGQVIQPGQVVTAVWAGGNAGATATVAVSGTRTVP